MKETIFPRKFVAQVSVLLTIVGGISFFTNSTCTQARAEELASATPEADVSCINPHLACPEAGEVIDTLKEIAKAYSAGDFSKLSDFLDNDITTFDDKKKKLIVGKPAVMEWVREQWDKSKSEGNPVESYTIDHPFAQVRGDTAIVTFRAVKRFGGKKPKAFASQCTDIFVKHTPQDGWKKLHYRTHWKEISI
ncbi:MAG: nuclear transport factor 2 family protein [Cyanobacteria bacterium TGS_CYA1]|nr:nuclear transport factor 2 family protein [Cyanobacteria bacterium TGS_CYA1]